MSDELVITPELIPVSIRSTNSLAAQVGNSRQLVIDIPDDGVSFEEVEAQVIAHTLANTDWNKNKAARMLKISRPRLLRKIEKYDLNPE